MKYENSKTERPKVEAVQTTFADIQKILDDAVEGSDVLAHGPFWRGVTRDQFVELKVFGCKIIFNENGTFVAAQSPLVHILQNPIECPASRPRPQMPVGFPPVPADKVQMISDWIDAQCPA